MIASLHGTVQQIGEDWIVVRVGGLGLLVNVTAGVINKMAEVGQLIDLSAHLVVREDSLTLYGFSSQEEKAVFGYVRYTAEATLATNFEELQPQNIASS